MSKMESTKDEAGVAEAEARVVSDVDDMFGPAPSQKEEVSDEADLDTVEDSIIEGGSKQSSTDDRRIRGEVLPDEQGDEEAEEEESEGGEAEQEGEEEDGEVEEGGETPNISLQEQSAHYRRLLNEAYKGNLPGSNIDEMAEQAQEDETPIPEIPTFAQLDKASLMKDLNPEAFERAITSYEGFVDVVGGLLEKAAGSAVQVSKLGMDQAVEGKLAAKSLVDNFMLLGHNADIQDVPDLVIQAGADFQRRNKDMSPSEALERGADQVRKDLKMPPTDKTKKGDTKTRIRGKKGVKPAKPRFAGSTQRRKAKASGGGDGDLSDFDKEMAEIHAAGKRSLYSPTR